MHRSGGGRGGGGRAGLASLLEDRNLLWAVLVSVLAHALVFALPSPGARTSAQPPRSIVVSLEPAAGPAPEALLERPPPAAAPMQAAVGAPARADPAAPDALSPPAPTDTPPAPVLSADLPAEPTPAAHLGDQAADPAPRGGDPSPAASRVAESVTPPAIREAPSRETATHRDRLLTELRRAVAGAAAYPVSARRRGLQGEVVIALTLEPGGAASSLSVRQSSGSPTLDRAALKAVRRTLPFPTSLSEPLRLEIPVAFRLED